MGRAVIASALFIACLGVALQSLATALNPSGPPLVFIAALCWNFLGLALEFSSLGLADFSPSLENRISVFTKTRFCSALPPRCVLRVSPAMPEASVQTLLCWVSGDVPSLWTLRLRQQVAMAGTTCGLSTSTAALLLGFAVPGSGAGALLPMPRVRAAFRLLRACPSTSRRAVVRQLRSSSSTRTSSSSCWRTDRFARIESCEAATRAVATCG